MCTMQKLPYEDELYFFFFVVVVVFTLEDELCLCQSPVWILQCGCIRVSCFYFGQISGSRTVV